VDRHSHFSLIGRQAISANLLPAPDGPVNSIPALQQTLRDFIATSPVVKVHQVVIGMSYDDSQLAEHRHPNRQELDAVSADLPILVIHRSGHIGVYNSKALAMLGITANTPNPAGGVIEREADGKTPSGVMEENAHFGLAYKMSRDYTHHFRIGGVKLTFDGSPQGKTAWFTQPYFKVPAGQKKTYAGYPAFTDAEALKWARYQCAVKSSSFSSRAFA